MCGFAAAQSQIIKETRTENSEGYDWWVVQSDARANEPRKIFATLDAEDINARLITYL